MGAAVSDAVHADRRLADAPERERYEATDDDGVLGFARYRLQPGVITFVHTEVDARAEGQGVGSELVRFALDDTRARGLAVMPFCPFVNGWMRRHREYADLVPERDRGQFGLD